MIICPNCRHEEMSGAIYCSECGAKLMDGTAATHEIPTAETRLEAEQDTIRTQTSPPVSLQSRISLNMIESGQILPLADRAEYTLGRSTEDQPIALDVDLSPHDAYAKGVSRLHAVLKLIQDKFVIMDLGSSNGTYLNGTRLKPYVEMPVAHGDIIHLGKLKMQVLIV